MGAERSPSLRVTDAGPVCARDGAGHWPWLMGGPWGLETRAVISGVLLLPSSHASPDCPGVFSDVWGQYPASQCAEDQGLCPATPPPLTLSGTFGKVQNVIQVQVSTLAPLSVHVTLGKRLDLSIPSFPPCPPPPAMPLFLFGVFCINRISSEVSRAEGVPASGTLCRLSMQRSEDVPPHLPTPHPRLLQQTPARCLGLKIALSSPGQGRAAQHPPRSQFIQKLKYLLKLLPLPGDVGVSGCCSGLQAFLQRASPLGR